MQRIPIKPRSNLEEAAIKHGFVSDSVSGRPYWDVRLALQKFEAKYSSLKTLLSFPFCILPLHFIKEIS